MTENNTPMFVTVIVAGISLAIYTWFQKNKESVFTFLKVLALFILVLLLVALCIWRLVVYFKKKFKIAQELEYSKRNFESKLHALSNKHDSVEALVQIEELRRSYSDLAQEFAEKISEIVKRHKKIILENNLQVKQERLLREQEKRKELVLRNESDNRIRKLFEFFKEKKSAEVIPEWAIEMPGNEIETAKNEFNVFQIEEKEIKDMKRRVLKFIIKNKGYPSDFTDLDETEKEMYKKYIKLSEFDLRKKLGFGFGETFFIASELMPDKRGELFKKGFRNVPFNNPKTGKMGLNFIIWNDPRKESDYHFCLKNWFAKEFHGEIEFLVDKVRVDVVIKGIALEIETGKNKDLQVQKKVEVLQRKFTEWYIVCSRQNKAKYAKFAPRNRILTMTEAYAKLKALSSH